ncbi:hypothetical protein Patl1_30370 [Pistacia atlantica]|uniref:Uncharacterized protein n=1 Tax=Pistacia atlantica TaxID=434234 RepID=A0ACC1A9W2_9ROSI|nr:hypothetical protein Patl1_30370 [Pistacia atlantica]
MRPIRLPEPPTVPPAVCRRSFLAGLTQSSDGPLSSETAFLVRRIRPLGWFARSAYLISTFYTSELNLLTYYFLHGSSLSIDEAREVRVTRPRGGINELLHWLPVSLHKKLDYVMRQICGYSRLLLTSRREKLVPLPLENGSASLSSVLEANVKQIVTMARDTYEKYALF